MKPSAATSNHSLKPADHIAYCVHIAGLVQGVFFRKRTVEVARERGLTGIVRNLADGRVEVLVAGPTRDVQDLILWLRHGPRDARVSDLTLNALTDAQKAEIDKIGTGNFRQV